MYLSPRTKVGICGYGRFGSFLAKEMSRSFDVIVTDINLTNIDQKQKSLTYLLENEFFLTDFDIVVFANSINSFECVIEKIGKINPSSLYMSPEEHDKIASRSQLITHFIGRILNELQLQPSNIDTFSFQSLLKIINVTCSDSKELFLGLARKNKNTRKMIDDLKLALSKIESEIFND